MHRRVAVIAERDIVKQQLRRHAHLMDSRTTAHSTAQTVKAAPSRVTTGIRRIDQGATCAGCGEAVAW
jgi:hypothetical protein